MRIIHRDGPNGVPLQIALCDESLHYDDAHIPPLPWSEIYSVVLKRDGKVFTALAGRPDFRRHIAFRVYENTHFGGGGQTPAITDRAAARPFIRLKIIESQINLQVSFRVDLEQVRGAKSVVILLREDCMVQICCANKPGQCQLTRVGPLLHVRTTDFRNRLEIRYELPRQRSECTKNSVTLLQADGTLPKLLYPVNSGHTCLSIKTFDRNVITNARRIDAQRYLSSRGEELVVLIAPRGSFNLRFDFSDGLLVRSFGLTARYIEIRNELTRTIDFFQQLFGQVGQLTVLEFPIFDALAVSYPHLILFDPRLLNTPDALLCTFLPHEVAHQWIGNKVRCVDEASVWLQEGLAEYLQLLYLRSRFGQSYFDERLEETSTLATLDDKSLNNYDVLLARAALIWHRVSTNVGQTSFRCFLKTLSRECLVASVSDLLQIVGSHANEE